MEFSRQECWSGLPFLPPGNLPDSSRTLSPVSPALAGRFLTTLPPGKFLTPPKMNYNKRDSGPAEPVEWKEQKLGRFLPILPSRSCSCRSTPGDKGYSACSVTSLVSDSLWSLMGRGPPGSSVHGILQARILELVAVPSSRDIPDPGMESESLTLQVNSLPPEPSGKP